MGVCCVYAWSGERRESPCVKRHTNVVVRCVRVVCGCVVWLRVGACVDGRAGSPTPWSAVGVGEEVIAIAGSCFCALPLRAGSAVCEPFFCGSADCSFDQLRTSRGKRRSTASVGGFVAILSVDAVCLERKVVVESAARAFAPKARISWSWSKCANFWGAVQIHTTHPCYAHTADARRHSRSGHPPSLPSPSGSARVWCRGRDSGEG